MSSLSSWTNKFSVQVFSFFSRFNNHNNKTTPSSCCLSQNKRFHLVFSYVSITHSHMMCLSALAAVYHSAFILNTIHYKFHRCYTTLHITRQCNLVDSWILFTRWINLYVQMTAVFAESGRSKFVGTLMKLCRINFGTICHIA